MDDEEIEAGALKLSNAYVRHTIFENNTQAIAQVMLDTKQLVMDYIKGRKANADPQKLKEETRVAGDFLEKFRKIMEGLMIYIVDENVAQTKSGDSQRPPHVLFQTFQNDVAAAHAQLLKCEQEKKDLLLKWEQEKKYWEQEKENLMTTLEFVTKTNKSLLAESDQLMNQITHGWGDPQKRGGGGVSTEGKKRRNKYKSRRNKNKSKKRSNKNVKK
jgi:hypothetical protein